MPLARAPLHGITIRLDDHPVRAETRYVALGVWTVHLASCLLDRGIELHSTYTGHPCTSSQAQHLPLAPGTPAASSAAEHDEHELPVYTARRQRDRRHAQHRQHRPPRIPPLHPARVLPGPAAKRRRPRFHGLGAVHAPPIDGPRAWLHETEPSSASVLSIRRSAGPGPGR